MKRSIKTLENVISDDTFAVADYPACKLFFPITETSGASITDLVAGVSASPVGIVDSGKTPIFASNYMTHDDIAGVLDATVVGYPDLGATKDWIMIAVADFADNGGAVIGIGSAAGGGSISMKGNSKIKDVTPNADDLTGSAIDANTVAAALYTDLAGAPDIYLTETDGTTVLTDADTLALTAVDGMDFDTADASFTLTGSTGTALYGVALFSFTAFPSDISAALSWMNYQWRQGNKVIYPAWKGKT